MSTAPVRVEIHADATKAIDMFQRIATEASALFDRHARAIYRWERHHPRRLPIDGHAYRRRTRHRSRS